MRPWVLHIQFLKPVEIVYSENRQNSAFKHCQVQPWAGPSQKVLKHPQKEFDVSFGRTCMGRPLWHVCRDKPLMHSRFEFPVSLPRYAH